MSYDTSITVFSPTGNLHQVDYAGEAVKQGGCAVYFPSLHHHRKTLLFPISPCNSRRELAVFGRWTCLQFRCGALQVAVVGKGCIVFAVEQQATLKLQRDSASQKIFQLDDHIIATFAGLQADARILVDRVRLFSARHPFACCTSATFAVISWLTYHCVIPLFHPRPAWSASRTA
ncbi:hypothetical protein [Delftia acidovorans]